MAGEYQEEWLGKDLPTGSHHYRAFVGPPDKYDLVSAMQFNLLTYLGLREYHSLLDIGCGSLRGGRLFIPYLLPQRYFGIEPEQWLVEEGIKKQLGKELIDIKQPTFSDDCDFTLSAFGRKFDFILAQSIFSHASQHQIRRCLSEARKVMKLTSIFAATFVEGEQDYEGNEWVYPGCVTYTLERMMHLAKEQGLVCQPIGWPHPNQQTWVAIVDPENEESVPASTDFTELQRLQERLMFYKERLSKIENHPYVRLGLGMYRFIQRVKQRMQ